LCNSTVLLINVTVRRNVRPFLQGPVFRFWLGGWKRRQQGGNLSLAHTLVLDAERFPRCLSGGGEVKNGAMLCEPHLGGYMLRSKLAGLFGSMGISSQPLWGVASAYPGMRTFPQPII